MDLPYFETLSIGVLLGRVVLGDLDGRARDLADCPRVGPRT